MSKPKRQRTVHVTIKDRETGWVMITSIRVERRKIGYAPHDGLSSAKFGPAPFDRMDARALRLGQLLQRRWFGVLV